jgi:hypothetical protein
MIFGIDSNSPSAPQSSSTRLCYLSSRPATFRPGDLPPPHTRYSLLKINNLRSLAGQVYANTLEIHISHIRICVPRKTASQDM